MTWRELRNDITSMTETELDQVVTFAEPLDDGQCFPVHVAVAAEDIPYAWGDAANPDDAEHKETVIAAGERFLSA